MIHLTAIPLAALFAVLPADTSLTAQNAAVTVEFRFDAGPEGWQGGFADYPAGEEAFYELDFDHRALPERIGPGSGLFITGNNHSDDLFMYFKRRIGPEDGLAPHAAYRIAFEVEIGTEVPMGCIGVGGSPGESVYLRAGAAPVEPRAIDGGEFLVMNIDKGNQATGGEHAVVLGDIANSIPDCAEFRWERKLLDNSGMEFIVRTAADGTLWLFAGTDSGFEATTQLFYTRIRAELSPIDEPEADFIRGDSQGDGFLDISDAVHILGFLFLGLPGRACEKAADTDDNGSIEITDAIAILGHLFLGDPPPAAPYPQCGADFTPDPLRCPSFPPCGNP